MVVKQLLSVDDFGQINSTSLIHFYADGVEECTHMNLVLDGLADESEYKNVTFAKCLAENFPDILEKYEISEVPTFLFFQHGECVDRLMGADAIGLNEKLKEMIKNSVDDNKTQLEAKLESLINSAPVMLFIKGTPEKPQCKFSKQIVSVLNELNAEYGSFNILMDEEVRGGLKLYSNWPTYPQLYINGDLIGGLDIVNELKTSGELGKILPTTQKTQTSSKLNDMLKSLIDQAEVMVFIKGDRASPKCKFSNLAVKLLDDTGIPFNTFNVLENDEVRQGLKTYSDWPTYPQIYVKGAFIGGVDIIEALNAENKLIATLKGET